MASSTERAQSEHLSEVEHGRHVNASAPGQGACLFVRCKEGDPRKYIEGNTCNYRWQAYLNTEARLKDRFNWPSYKDFFEELYDHPTRREKKTGSGATESLVNLYEISLANVVPVGGRGGKSTPSYMRSASRMSKAQFMQAVENDKPWDFHKVYNNGVETFKKNASIPYPFNSHHLIPNETFNECLDDAAKTDETLYQTIRTSLLEAKYNVHYKDNLVILPMLRRAAKAVSMPLHCAGSYNHDVYNAKATSALKKVFADYAAQIANQNHDQRVPAFQKQRLLRISNRLFDMTTLYGLLEAGGDLDAMDDTYWSGLAVS